MHPSQWIKKSRLSFQEKLNFLPEYKSPCFLRSGRVMCLPYFMLLGVAKCGTTDLHNKLLLHPQIEAARVKETHWYNRGRLGKSNVMIKMIKKKFHALIFTTNICHFSVR